MTCALDVQEVLSSSTSVAAGKRWSGQDAKAAADALVAAATQKGTLDNVTAIVCRKCPGHHTNAACISRPPILHSIKVIID